MLHRAQVRAAKIDAYYRHFDEHQPFVDTLWALNAQIIGITKDIGRSAFTDSLYCHQLLTTFIPIAEAWHLPKDRGAADLLQCFTELEMHRIQPLRVSEVILSYREPLDDADDSELAKAYQIVMEGAYSAMIRPPVIASFWYDPTQHSSTYLEERTDAIVAEIRKSIADQATALQALAASAGFQKMPKRYGYAFQSKNASSRSSPIGTRMLPEINRMAGRLFRAAVLEEGWSAIARWEANAYPAGREVSPEAVSESVKNWAADLQVTLPPRRRGGPPKSEGYHSRRLKPMAPLVGLSEYLFGGTKPHDQGGTH